MNKVLIIGAGRSASSLIRYMAEQAKTEGWQVTVADYQLELAQEKTEDFPQLKAISFDIFDAEKAKETISDYHVVISLLPPALHIKVAEFCLQANAHLITASYISKEMKALDEQAKSKNLLFLNEIGLDPGIDHLSAMELIDEVKEREGKILSFKSFTGGLIAPESDNNPWHYKFTWNPQNVVLAGQGIATYLESKQVKLIPYHQLFKRIDTIEVEGYGTFEGYANRDSLSYIEVYGLQEADTILRGTLRKAGYCEAWNSFVQLGMTDNTTPIHTAKLTKRDFVNTFLPYHPTQSVEDKLCVFLGIDSQNEVFKRLAWLDLFESDLISYPKEMATPAQILQFILEPKWALDTEDKDMIVMQHQLTYRKGDMQADITSELVVIGEDTTHTAMAKTVGLPLGIAAKLLLQGKLSLTGVQIPIQKEIYEPVLKELAALGIIFKNKKTVHLGVTEN